MSVLEKLRYLAFLSKHGNETERPDAIGAHQNPTHVAAVFLNGSGDVCDRAARQYCMLVDIDEQLGLFERITINTQAQGRRGQVGNVFQFGCDVGKGGKR